MDLQRKEYYEHYTGLVWGDPENYDLHIDTGKISIEQAVELIAQWFRS